MTAPIDSTRLEAVILGRPLNGHQAHAVTIVDMVPGSLVTLAGLGWGDPGGVYQVTERTSGLPVVFAAGDISTWRGPLVAEAWRKPRDAGRLDFDIEGLGRITVNDPADLGPDHRDQLRPPTGTMDAHLAWAATTLPALALSVEISRLPVPQPDVTILSWLDSLPTGYATADEEAATTALRSWLRSADAFRFLFDLFDQVEEAVV